MSQAGMILDVLLIALLLAALGYGVRLEAKLRALREGQVGFAKAVGELNGAAARAEAAISTLRNASEETDLLHDRIVKARALKSELAAFIEGVPLRSQAARTAPAASEARPAGPVEREPAPRVAPRPAAHQGPTGMKAAAGPVLQALAANQAAQQSINRARRKLDEDLFQPAA